MKSLPQREDLKDPVVEKKQNRFLLYVTNKMFQFVNLIVVQRNVKGNSSEFE